MNIISYKTLWFFFILNCLNSYFHLFGLVPFSVISTYQFRSLKLVCSPFISVRNEVSNDKHRDLNNANELFHAHITGSVHFLKEHIVQHCKSILAV